MPLANEWHLEHPLRLSLAPGFNRVTAEHSRPPPTVSTVFPRSPSPGQLGRPWISIRAIDHLEGGNLTVSTHSYSRCWIHLTWATRRREPILSKSAAVDVSGFLTDYAKGKGIYMAINYVNHEHTHALIDLPTSYSV